MATVKHYFSLIKFSHTIFAMPFAMIGFVLGTSAFHFGESFMVKSPGKFFFLLLMVLLCMISARSAAMAFNRFLDRHFDAANPRTAIREIPSGMISANNALFFTIACSIAFMACCYFINKMVFILSPVALFVILFYSYTKRFTPLCHLVLGLGLSLAPLGAYLAVTAQWAALPVIFSFAVLFWVSGFDIMYALQDIDFDKSQKLHSIPAWVGLKNALIVSKVLHFLCAAFVIAAGIYGQFSWLYWIGVIIFCGCLIYQQSIVKPDNLSRINIAFMTSNGFASIVFGVLVIADILLLK